MVRSLRQTQTRSSERQSHSLCSATGRAGHNLLKFSIHNSSLYPCFSFVDNRNLDKLATKERRKENDHMRFRRLERHKVGGTDDRMVLSVPLPRTASGKLYQYSPNPDAAPRLFLMGNAPEERSIADEHRCRIRRNPAARLTCRD